jgi:hypothetical protein
MSHIQIPSRRAILAGSGALAVSACAHDPNGASPATDLIFRGLNLPSESVHSGVASIDGQNRLTIRLCRYPTMQKAWLWVHVRTPRGFYSFVDHLAPSGPDATPTDDSKIRYSDARDLLVFERTGPASLPAAATVSADVRAVRSADYQPGKETHAVSARIEFRPARAYSGLNAGRTEVFGMARATIKIDGNAIEFDGPAQFHEQRQSEPRFMTPFAYITLWSPDAGATFLATPRRADGYLLEGAASNEATLLRLDPPGRERRTLAIRLKDGRLLEGETHLTAPYARPIYGEPWRGHFLSATLGGRTFQGNINDFQPDRLTYPG